jgi:hypothetical protein
MRLFLAALREFRWSVFAVAFLVLVWRPEHLVDLVRAPLALLFPTLMTRIVTTHYRCKRPPRKRKPAALEVPEIVTAARAESFRRGRRPPWPRRSSWRVANLNQSR